LVIEKVVIEQEFAISIQELKYCSGEVKQLSGK